MAKRKQYERRNLLVERFKKCHIWVNKETVIRLVNYKFGSVTRYTEKKGISRVRFYQIVNEPHLSKNSKCLQDLAKDLQVSIETILL